MAHAHGRFATGLRWGVALLFVVAAGLWVMRSTIVELGSGASEVAGGTWPSHPDVLAASMMAEVGEAAARGAEPDAGTLGKAELLAAKQPLSPFPFLVHAALAARSGDYDRAELLLLEARRRAPRAPAARYMLADLFLRTDRALPAMGEMAVLNRLVPGTAAQLAPALAAYATSPQAVGQLKTILSSYPELEPPLLAQLASNGADGRLILGLAHGGGSKPASRDWQRNVLNSMIAHGQYADAYAVWARFSGMEARPSSLFNPDFSPIEAPPPFNWDFAQGSGGLADPRSGSLQVLYYGRENLALATQLLLLQPGRYQLAMNVVTNEGEPQALRWTLTCINGSQLLDLPLASNRLSGEFAVPAGCSAQKLELLASPKEDAERAELTISAMQLTKL